MCIQQLTISAQTLFDNENYILYIREENVNKPLHQLPLKNGENQTSVQYCTIYGCSQCHAIHIWFMKCVILNIHCYGVKGVSMQLYGDVEACV